MVEYENAPPNAVVVATVGSGVGPVSAELSGVRLDGVCWIRPSVDAERSPGKDIWAQLDDEPDDVGCRRRLGRHAGTPPAPADDQRHRDDRR